MNFTKDVQKFKQTVDNSKVSGGRDAFESGMDGIMQAVACKGGCQVLFYISYVNENKMI